MSLSATHLGSPPRRHSVGAFRFERERGEACDAPAFDACMMSAVCDCAFGSYAGLGAVGPEIAGAKLATLEEAVRRAA